MADTGRRTGLPDGICRRCRRPLLWAWVLDPKRRGQRIPLDPEERPRDDVEARYAVSRDHLKRVRVRQLDDGEAPAPWETRGMSHLWTCPVLVARREAVASLRRARAAAPNPYDVEDLAEARQERRP